MKLRLAFLPGSRVGKGAQTHLKLALDEPAAYRKALNDPTHQNWESYHQARQRRENFERGRGL